MKYHDVPQFKTGLPFEIYCLNESERLKLNFEIRGYMVITLPPDSAPAIFTRIKNFFLGKEENK